MMSPEAPDFGAASDGDGDRNLIIGRGIFVTPSDSLAMLAANAHHRAGLCRGARGHRPLDADQRRRRPRRRAARPQLLRDADGLEILRQPARRRPRDDLRRGELGHRLQPCAREGRALGGAALAQHPRQAPHRRARPRARALVDLRAQLLYAPRLRRDRSCRRQRADGRAARPALKPRRERAIGALKVKAADDFAYHDPVDGSDTAAQGVRILFEGGSRIVYRLSGTGTVGRDACASISSAMRRRAAISAEETQAALADLIALSRSPRRLEKRTGRTAPSVIT